METDERREKRYALAMIIEWVKQALAHSGMSQAELARQLHQRFGWNNDRSLVNKILNNNRKVSAEEMLEISEVTQYPLPAEMATDPKKPIVKSFDPDEQDAPEETMTAGSETGRRGVPDDASAQIDVTAGMGGGGLTLISDGVPGKNGMTFAAHAVSDYWRLPPAVLVSLGLKAQDVSIFPVQGDSMFPTLNEGDVVFIDTRHRWPSPAGLYAVLDEIGGIVVKRLEVSSAPGSDETIVRVISDNPRHAPKEWRAEDIQIIGRVLRKFGVVS